MNNEIKLINCAKKKELKMKRKAVLMGFLYRYKK